MGHDLRPDLHHLLPETGQRPRPDRFQEFGDLRLEHLIYALRRCGGGAAGWLDAPGEWLGDAKGAYPFVRPIGTPLLGRFALARPSGRTDWSFRLDAVRASVALSRPGGTGR